MTDRAGARWFGGVALGCGLLALVDLAAFGLVLMGAAVLGGPEGDVGLVLYMVLPSAMVFPFIQPAWSALTALVLLIARRRPMALGVVLGSGLTLVGFGGLVAYVVSVTGVLG